MRSFDHATILSYSFHGLRKKHLAQWPAFCFLLCPKNSGGVLRGCAAPFLKPLPYFRAKSVYLKICEISLPRRLEVDWPYSSTKNLLLFRSKLLYYQGKLPVFPPRKISGIVHDRVSILVDSPYIWLGAILENINPAVLEIKYLLFPVKDSESKMPQSFGDGFSSSFCHTYTNYNNFRITRLSARKSEQTKSF